jgi:hypothetical protein
MSGVTVSAPRRRWDYALATLFFTLGTGLGIMFMGAVGLTYVNPFFPSAVIWACGHANGEPVVVTPPIWSFLTAATRTFDCANLPDNIQTVGMLPFARSHFYLVWLLSLNWRILGVSYDSLWASMALLYGSFGLALFALFRSIFSRHLAVVGATVTVCSPFSLSILVALRDFAKAPFIIGASALLLHLLRPARIQHLAPLYASCGLLIGVGIGFRTDVAVMIIPGVIFAAIFSKPITQPLLGRGICTVSFLAGVLITAAPITNGGMSGGFGFTALQGLTVPFGQQLGVRTNLYDLGARYSDEWTLSTIAADLRRSDPTAYDAQERASNLDVTLSVTRSSSYSLRQVPNFAADLVIRAFRSVWELTSFYPAIAPDRRSLDGVAVIPAIAFSSTFVSSGFKLLEATLYRPWVGYFGPPAFLVFLFYIWSNRGARYASGVAFLLLTLLTYPALQFSFRHFFFLEFIPWLGILAVISLAKENETSRRKVVSFGAALACSVLVAFGVLALLRQLQSERLKQQIGHDLSTAINVRIGRTPDEDGRTLLSWPMPEEARIVLSEPVDSLAVPGELRAPTTVVATSERIVIRMSRQGCASADIRVAVEYAKTANTWQAFDRDFDVRLGTGTTILIVPAFYRTSQHVAGIRVPTECEASVLSIARVPKPSSLPSGFAALLPEGWQGVSLHQRFGSLWP